MTYAHLCTGSDQLLSSIAELREDLLDVMEPNFGLLDVLVTLQVLTHRQRQDVDAEKAVYRKNARILDCLTTEDQRRQFLAALEKTNQRHVVNFITKKGDS